MRVQDHAPLLQRQLRLQQQDEEHAAAAVEVGAEGEGVVKEDSPLMEHQSCFFPNVQY